jgi:hypothetical protein
VPGAFGLTIKSNRIPAVESALRAGALSAIGRRGGTVLQTIQAYEHVITGRMRRETRLTVGVMRNDVATAAIISDVPYAVDEELGNRFRPGHHRIQAGAAAAKAGYEAGVANDLGAAALGAAR